MPLQIRQEGGAKVDGEREQQETFKTKRGGERRERNFLLNEGEKRGS